MLGLLLFAAAAENLLPGGRQRLIDTIGAFNFAGGFIFFAFAIVACKGLLAGTRWALTASMIIQLIQAVSFAVLGGLHVNIAAGPAIDLTVGRDAVAANLGLHSSFFVGTRLQGAAWEVTVNLLALAWAIALARAQAVRVAPAGSNAL